MEALTLTIYIDNLKLYILSLVSIFVFLFCLSAPAAYAYTYQDTLGITQFTTSDGRTVNFSPYTSGGFSDGRGGHRGGRFAIRGGQFTNTEQPPSASNPYYLVVDNDVLQVSTISYVNDTSYNFTTLNNTTYYTTYNNQFITYTVNNTVNTYYYQTDIYENYAQYQNYYINKDPRFIWSYFLPSDGWHVGDLGIINERSDFSWLYSGHTDERAHFWEFKFSSSNSWFPDPAFYDFDFVNYDYYLSFQILRNNVFQNSDIKVFSEEPYGTELIPIQVYDIDQLFVGRQYYNDIFTDVYGSGKSFVFKLDHSFNKLYLYSRFDMEVDSLFRMYLTVRPKGSDINIVINQDQIINNTENISNNIDYISYGDSNTTTIINQGDTVISNFNQEINNLNQNFYDLDIIEDTWKNKLHEAQDNIDIVIDQFDFSEGQTSGANFLSTSMTSVFSSLGDYQLPYIFSLILFVRGFFVL